jgi:hypothetical protein
MERRGPGHSQRAWTGFALSRAAILVEDEEDWGREYPACGLICPDGAQAHSSNEITLYENREDQFF